ncbi:hypothetical protein HII31_12667 [Pseudocercospora fuligena]|uniref:OsmC-like protein n=1 Tax=Pseudocercospora fuligena TaxID=685502 RepID=A0A8H6R7W4_9PEZI|nr:hypothetical protein HII31_12667 [Pseudocercospora fuligena]
MTAINRPMRSAVRNARLTPTCAARRTFARTAARLNTIPFEVKGQGTGVAQKFQVANSSHVINTDAYPAFGGKDAYPSPLHFNLTALSSCTQVTGSIVAKDLGISISKWNVSVKGDLDPSVLIKGVEGNANWSAITLSAEIESDADDATFKKLGEETERRCPVTQLFKRSGVDWQSSWKNSKS